MNWVSSYGATVQDLPRLLHALHTIEGQAIRDRELLAEDYENAGCAVPKALMA